MRVCMCVCICMRMCAVCCTFMKTSLCSICLCLSCCWAKDNVSRAPYVKCRSTTPACRREFLWYLSTAENMRDASASVISCVHTHIHTHTHTDTNIDTNIDTNTNIRRRCDDLTKNIPALVRRLEKWMPPWKSAL
jgi:hypothetical protein